MPVDDEWQRDALRIMDGCDSPNNCLYKDSKYPVKLVKKRPTKIADVIGDGNCQLRCLSLAICGNQSLHKKIRNIVLNYMLANKDIHEDFSDRSVGRPFEEYVESMRPDGIWFGDRELLAFSYLFDTPVYVCFKCVQCISSCGQWGWDRYPHPHLEDVHNEKGIYLLNEPTNVHYKFVVQP
jgi:hypothetical protein